MNLEKSQRIARLREYFDGHPFGSQICRDVHKTCDEAEGQIKRGWLGRLLGL